MRKELQQAMIDSFPFDKIPYGYSDFERVAFDFLSNIGSNIISYNQLANPNISSIPNLIKPYFTNFITDELNILVTKIHTNETLNVYFTFDYLWDNGSTLKTVELGLNSIIHETVLSDNELVLEDFFKKFKPIFEHSEKHDNTKYTTKEEWRKGEWKANNAVFISGLSCYDGKDGSIPQELLNKAMKDGKKYYNYDSHNETYVIFQCTRDNIYHGYDEFDVHAIPSRIRKHFLK